MGVPVPGERVSPVPGERVSPVPGERVSRDLGSATWVEVEAAAESRPLTLVVPVGSIEQHGPHLPLNTDVVIAEHIAARAVDEAEDHVWFGPTINLGSAGEHRGFAGSLSIGQDATADTLIEVVRSAITSEKPWCDRVVLVVGHGGNVEPVLRAVRIARSEGRQVSCWFPTDPDGDAHAGRTETSVMMAIDPALVGDVPESGGYDGPLAKVRDLLVSEGLGAVTRNGVLGAPAAATPEYGRELIARWVGEVLETVSSGLRVDDSSISSTVRAVASHRRLGE